MKRLAKTEVGINLDVGKTNLLGVFEDLDEDPRGHVIDVIYGLELNDPAGLTNKSKQRN